MKSIPLTKLWLDDFRPAPDDTWAVSKTAQECIALLKAQQWDILELDHDLGHCGLCENCNGYKSSCGCLCHQSGSFVVNWMITEGTFPKEVRIHSANPIGAKNMQALLERYGPYDKVVWEPAWYSEKELEEKRRK